uniref:Wall-associated receptor kinase-like 2 n=1 Tax=Tanacetum cinerariifolium TaxID=118510 RepID=A0A6L2P590_TANCI|nr:wall-associated receptor kinase-like 2 [Tanacetum cinerariifolium]
MYRGIVPTPVTTTSACIPDSMTIKANAFERLIDKATLAVAVAEKKKREQNGTASTTADQKRSSMSSDDENALNISTVLQGFFDAVGLLLRGMWIRKRHSRTWILFCYALMKLLTTGRFTAKSDVYAFGVVLIELSTRRKYAASIDSDEGLILRFQHLMKHNRMFEILDTRVVEEAWMNDVVLQFIVDKIKL